MSTAADRRPVGYTLQPFEERLALLELERALDPRMLAFTARIGGHATHQFYFDRFTKLQGDGGALSLRLQAEATNDGHRGAAHNYLTHGLHSYKGKYFPQLVRALLNAAPAVAPGQVVDPFVGSGTTTLEASLMGFAAHGIDRNPLAALIARTKVAVLQLDPDAAAGAADELVASADASRGGDLANRQYLERWFPPDTLRLIERILGGAARADVAPALRDLARLSLSALLRQWSLQEPTQLRIFRRETAPPAEQLRVRWENEVRQTCAGVLTGLRLLRELEIEPGAVSTVEGDARESATWHGQQFDALVTSPPYAAALPYIDTDRLSIYALGLADVGDRSALEWAMIGNRELRKRQRLDLEARLQDNADGLPERVVTDIAEIKRRNDAAGVGFRRENLPALLYRYFADMAAVLCEASAHLKPGALCAIVIGDSYTSAGDERFQIRTADFLCDVAESLRFTVEERIVMGGQSSYLPHQRNTIPSEDILMFRAPHMA